METKGLDMAVKSNTNKQTQERHCVKRTSLCIEIA